MNKVLLLFVVFVVCIACTDKHNMLTEKEKQDGWICLFNGKDFSGWRGHSRNDIPQVWKIDDHSIMVQAQKDVRERDGGSIIYGYKFRNFELKFDWKVSKGANSGVFYFVQEGPDHFVSKTGLEYQILDNEHHPDAKKGKDGNRTSAAIYDLIPPVTQNVKPFGEWNTGMIIFNHGKVTHYQNGAKVLEAKLWTDEWNELVDNSKFKELDDMINVGRKYENGYIALQDHKDDVWFRNLKIRILH